MTERTSEPNSPPVMTETPGKQRDRETVAAALRPFSGASEREGPGPTFWCYTVADAVLAALDQACEWTATGRGTDRAAERHTRDATHTTEVVSRPEEQP